MFIYLAGDIPDIGFRAGIKGNHFNIKLTTKMQKNFDDIAAIWNGKSKRNK